mmetsp:Transcript_26034/g.68376  ORF Transcript_26034/g.68376 Transcript_26034/m.68376 type:complete len:104 (+) Transcript_26034:852-1163(+)
MVFPANANVNADKARVNIQTSREPVSSFDSRQPLTKTVLRIRIKDRPMVTADEIQRARQFERLRSWFGSNRIAAEMRQPPTLLIGTPSSAFMRPCKQLPSTIK